MVNMLVVEDNINQCTQLTNLICKNVENIRVYGLSQNGQEAMEVIKWIYVKFLDTFFENFFIFMSPLSSLYYILNLYWYKWYTELLTSPFTPIRI